MTNMTFTQRAATLNAQEWFHATTVDRWHARVSAANVWVHVGTKSAAYDRTMRVTAGGVLRQTEAHDFYTLIIKDDIRVYPFVVVDENDWSENLDASGYDVFVYANDHEDEGSLSLLVAPRALEVVSVSRMDPDSIPARPIFS